MTRYNMITDEEIKGKVRILSVKDYESTVGTWVKYSDIHELSEENKNLTALFNLQHKRSITADKLWQQCTENTGVYPDLGVLLKWFMDERAEMMRVFESIRDEVEGVLGQ